MASGADSYYQLNGNPNCKLDGVFLEAITTVQQLTSFSFVLPSPPGRCYFCGSSVNQSRIIYLTAVAGFVAMSILALGVAFLSSLNLARLIQVFTVLQSVAGV